MKPSSSLTPSTSATLLSALQALTTAITSVSMAASPLSCVLAPLCHLPPSLLSFSEFLSESPSLRSCPLLLSFLVFIGSAVPSQRSHGRRNIHTHTHMSEKSQTHTQPIVQPKKWLAGNVKCSVTPSQQIQSLEMQHQPESPEGHRAFSEMQTIIQANCIVPSTPPSSITSNLYEPTDCGLEELRGTATE